MGSTWEVLVSINTLTMFQFLGSLLRTLRRDFWVTIQARRILRFNRKTWPLISPTSRLLSKAPERWLIPITTSPWTMIWCPQLSQLLTELFTLPLTVRKRLGVHCQRIETMVRRALKDRGTSKIMNLLVLKGKDSSTSLRSHCKSPLNTCLRKI